MPFYAVKKGRKIGVYTNWFACKEQVDRFVGADFKRFETYPDAYQFVYGRLPKCEESHNSNDVQLYTDGACSGNPGKGGYGYVVVIEDTVSLQGSGGLLSTTNNQMELTAVIEGLKVIPPEYAVTVYSDSSYVVNAFNKDWIKSWKKRHWTKSSGDAVANRELWEALLMSIERHPSVQFVWVQGHAGNQYNEMCDRLAVTAIRNL